VEWTVILVYEHKTVHNSYFMAAFEKDVSQQRTAEREHFKSVVCDLTAPW